MFLFYLFKADRTCQPGYVKCQTTNICIPHFYLCDEDNDCGDMSDESPIFCGKIARLFLLWFRDAYLELKVFGLLVSIS